MSNDVKMMGPGGKVAYVSKKVAESRHAAEIGYRKVADIIPQVEEDDTDEVVQTSEVKRGRKPKTENHAG